eukprot:g11152.t1
MAGSRSQVLNSSSATLPSRRYAMPRPRSGIPFALKEPYPEAPRSGYLCSNISGINALLASRRNALSKSGVLDAASKPVASSNRVSRTGWMKELQLLKFVDAADDGVVLVILRCLGTTALVRLASTSAFISSRLEDGRPTHLRKAVCPRLHRSARFVLRAMATGTVRSWHLPCTWPTLRAKVWLACSWMLCSAGNCGNVALADKSRRHVDLTEAFLPTKSAQFGALQAWQAVEILLTALLDVTTDVGCKLVHITAEAVRQAERDLDALIEAQAETLLSYGQGYEATARQRSAAEFIRHRALGGV